MAVRGLYSETGRNLGVLMKYSEKLRDPRWHVLPDGQWISDGEN